MKFPTIDYARAVNVDEVTTRLASEDETLVLAGGQSLMPMLSYRIARPARLIDISALPELQSIVETPEGLCIGAGVTHARLEDGGAAGPIGVFLARAAGKIAYRAIRTCGTVGGSLAHADPAADWPVIFAALHGRVEIAGPNGRRSLDVCDFIEGEMQTALQTGEIITAVTIPREQRRGLGLHKIVRKIGEFSDAYGVAVTSERSLEVWVGVVAGRPIRIDLPYQDARPIEGGLISNTTMYRHVFEAVDAAVPNSERYKKHLAALAGCCAIDDAISRGAPHSP